MPALPHSNGVPKARFASSTPSRCPSAYDHTGGPFPIGSRVSRVWRVSHKTADGRPFPSLGARSCGYRCATRSARSTPSRCPSQLHTRTRRPRSDAPVHRAQQVVTISPPVG